MEALTQQKRTALGSTQNPQLDTVKEYYNGATADYRSWSPQFYMHYGFMRRPWEFFSRKRMLENMNKEVGRRLLTQIHEEHNWADFGSGMGAVARYFSRTYSIPVSAINVVEMQNRYGIENTPEEAVRYITGDYHLQQLPENSITGAYAIESACHAYAPKALIRQMHNSLKSGGRLVLADCFCKAPELPKTTLEKKCLDLFARDWGVPGLWGVEETVAQLEKQGFQAIRVENISARVMPSVLHSPWVILQFLWKHRRNLKKWSKANLRGVLAAIGIGLHLHKYGYFLISATK
jgi:ubiquinone/menaquinone biosynthesis C-methylase UbiE